MTNIMELFEITMDSIFFDGYTRLLAENDPEKFNWELKEFINNF